MKKYLVQIADLAVNTFEKTVVFCRKKTAPILACIFSFCLVFGGIYITASRNIIIKQTRHSLSKTISYLNELGLDIAYDDIQFNSLFFSPLVEIKNFQLYNIKGDSGWSISLNKVKGYPNIFGTAKIRFASTEGGKVTLGDFSSQLSSKETFLDISSENMLIDEVVFHAEEIDIKNFAKIEKIAFLLQSSPQKDANSLATLPTYDSLFEVNDVNINGLVNYPLSSHLKLLYMKSNIFGAITPEEHLLTSLEDWLRQGGFIEIPNMIVQWEPLTMVGRGNIHFNEKFSPRIEFNTSSKGLLRLIDDLKKNEFLDSKNVFVANILLSNKAFKINPDDKELTITTPISYADGKISVENLTIKNFTK